MAQEPVAVLPVELVVVLAMSPRRLSSHPGKRSRFILVGVVTAAHITPSVLLPVVVAVEAATPQSIAAQPFCWWRPVVVAVVVPAKHSPVEQPGRVVAQAASLEPVLRLQTVVVAGAVPRALVAGAVQTLQLAVTQAQRVIHCSAVLAVTVAGAKALTAQEQLVVAVVVEMVAQQMLILPAPVVVVAGAATTVVAVEPAQPASQRRPVVVAVVAVATQ